MGWFDFTTDITGSAEYTVNQTLASSTQFVLVDASAGHVIVTLGAAADNTRTVHTIKKIDSTSNKVTIDADGSETIDGEATIDLQLQYSYVTIVCDGTEWFIIGGGNVKLEELIENKFDEQIELLRQIRTETGQSELHLASMSNADVTQQDAEDKWEHQ